MNTVSSQVAFRLECRGMTFTNDLYLDGLITHPFAVSVDGAMYVNLIDFIDLLGLDFDWDEEQRLCTLKRKQTSNFNTYNYTFDPLADEEEE